MLFIRKDKVDEDVEKIRQYTLGSTEKLRQEAEEEARLERRRKEISEQWTWKDILAMSIAVIEVILPYFVVMIGGMAIVILYFLWAGGR